MEFLKRSNGNYVVAEEGVEVQQFNHTHQNKRFQKVITNPPGISWAISSDNKIYLRVESVLGVIQEDSYENQRWNGCWIGSKFTAEKLQPSDNRANFSSQDGKLRRDLSSIELPNKLWAWDDSWHLELIHEGKHLTGEGWTYAWDLSSTFTPKRTYNSYVRRRKWVRNRRYNELHRWAPLPNSLLNVSFVDIAATAGGTILSGSPAPDLIFVWAVTEKGDLFLRDGVNLDTCPEGVQWLKIETPVAVCRVSASLLGVVLVLGRDERIFALDWQEKGFGWKVVPYNKEKVTFDEIVASIKSTEIGAKKSGFGRTIKLAGIAVGIGVAAGLAAPVLIPAALSAVGFTSSGVAAGSMAAAIQASIGNVAAGSAFALCQSIGATGIATGTAATIGVGTAGIVVITAGLHNSAGDESPAREVPIDEEKSPSIQTEPG